MTTTQITCPFEGCDVQGSIPGVKRHARKKHAITTYEAFDVFISEPTADEALSEDLNKSMKLAELKALASSRGLEVPTKVTKAQLYELLSA